MKTSNFKASHERLWGPRESVEHRDGGRMWVRPPRREELSYMHERLVSEVSPQVGSLQTMEAVYAFNSDTFWLVEHLTAGDAEPRKAGFFCFLILNAHGLAALEAGTLDRANPPLSALVPSGISPAALYIWAVVGRGVIRRLIHTVARALGPNYNGCPVYAFLATESGRQAGSGEGFAPTGDAKELRVGGLIKMPPWTTRRAA